MKKSSLKKMRESKGLTQKQVSILANTTVTYISLLENGRRNASDDMKRRLAKIYGCKIEDIFLALQLTHS